MSWASNRLFFMKITCGARSAPYHLPNVKELDWRGDEQGQDSGRPVRPPSRHAGQIYLLRAERMLGRKLHRQVRNEGRKAGLAVGRRQHQRGNAARRRRRPGASRGHGADASLCDGPCMARRAGRADAHPLPHEEGGRQRAGQRALRAHLLGRGAGHHRLQAGRVQGKVRLVLSGAQRGRLLRGMRVQACAVVRSRHGRLGRQLLLGHHAGREAASRIRHGCRVPRSDRRLRRVRSAGPSELEPDRAVGHRPLGWMVWKRVLLHEAGAGEGREGHRGRPALHQQRRDARGPVAPHSAGHRHRHAPGHRARALLGRPLRPRLRREVGRARRVREMARLRHGRGGRGGEDAGVGRRHLRASGRNHSRVREALCRK